jgi:hypothetical protein
MPEMMTFILRVLLIGEGGLEINKHPLVTKW